MAVVIIDDGSVAPRPDGLGSRFSAIRSVDVLELRRNLGHQRAIAVGLVYLHEYEEVQTVVVMDSDGEDSPEDVPRLVARLEELRHESVVFAERRKRSEGWLFRVFYLLYRLFHYAVVGNVPRVGNFSVLPRAILERLVVVSELWNHYAAAVFRARVPIAMLPTRRAKRLDGRSSMGFVGLVTHGLSAIAVQADVVGVRLLSATAVLMVAAVAAASATLGIRVFTDLAIPGWTTVVLGVSLVVFVQALLFAFALCVTILGGRSWTGFIPIRDYSYFIKGVARVYDGD